MKVLILSLSLIFMLYPSYGMIIGKVKIEGTVVKYDQKTVTLENEKGKRIKVSRQAIPKGVKLRTGARVHARFSQKAIAKQLNKKGGA